MHYGGTEAVPRQRWLCALAAVAVQQAGGLPVETWLEVRQLALLLMVVHLVEELKARAMQLDEAGQEAEVPLAEKLQGGPSHLLVSRGRCNHELPYTFCRVGWPPVGLLSGHGA